MKKAVNVIVISVLLGTFALLSGCSTCGHKAHKASEEYGGK
jgi:hypothetical protein